MISSPCVLASGSVVALTASPAAEKRPVFLFLFLKRKVLPYLSRTYLPHVQQGAPNSISFLKSNGVGRGYTRQPCSGVARKEFAYDPSGSLTPCANFIHRK